MQLKVGDKVHYIPFKGASNDIKENGIVKSHHDTDPNVVFVVYAWGDNPKNYQNYTGQSTPISNLKKGWI